MTDAQHLLREAASHACRAAAWLDRHDDVALAEAHAATRRAIALLERVQQTLSNIRHEAFTCQK